MKNYPTIAKYIPKQLQTFLYGKREYARDITLRDKNDKDYCTWLESYKQFYEETQRVNIGGVVCDWGFNILKKINLTNKKCLEIGPGFLPHTKFWNGTPYQYDLIDIKDFMLEESTKILHAAKIKTSSYISTEAHLSLESNTYDIVISFNCLEHLFGIESSLLEYKRILKKNGVFVGAIPTEGGFAWGLGRFLTTRRYVKNKFNIDYDKIIAWEHCNTAQEILQYLDKHFTPTHQSYRPLFVPSIDLNLMIRFIYQKD